MAAPSLARHLELDAGQIEQRRELGDQLDQLRFVDHMATFRHADAATAAADELRALGYEASVRRRLLGAAVEASKPETLDGDEPTRFVTEVFTVVARHGGRYDGWGGRMVAPTRNAPRRSRGDSPPTRD